MILITGATGLVGANLAMQLLEKEASVRAIYRKIESQQKTKALFDLHRKTHLFNKIQWIEADILDIPALELAFSNIDYVYHCAALVSFDPNDEEKLRKTNIEGTANIVNFCIDKKIKKLCHISSIAALGDKKEHEQFINETTEWNPEKNHSDYAISKYGAEMEVWRGYQEGLQVVIVNPGVILGSCFLQAGSNEIFPIVKKGLHFYTKGSTGFVAVTDLVLIMQQLMESKISGERFCVISQNKNFQELTFKIAETYKVKKPSLYANRFLTRFASYVDTILAFFKIKKSTFSKQIETSLHTTDVYSNHKIIETLGYKFMPIDVSIEAIIHQNKMV
jgi:dihydroflavonol-4-reductase